MENKKIDISSGQIDVSASSVNNNVEAGNIRFNAMIDLIQRQTDYNKEMAIEKLKKWNGNYLNVIKEWINPDFNEKKEAISKSKNQMIFGEIRNFMDTANRQYLQRKKRSEYIENQRIAYLNKLMQEKAKREETLKKIPEEKN
jgi:hypothetical protein|tara:strand:- start:3094 stop:3522 length:429 start_codon:yes stop_codon:yes gene_type:complete